MGLKTTSLCDVSGANHSNGSNEDEGSDAAPVHRSVLTPLAALAGRTETFRRSLPVVLLNAVRNIRTFPQILRLIRTEPFRGALRRNPRFTLRCLTRDYLVRGLDIAVGVQCFLHHHRRMHAALSADLMRRITLGSVPLYEVSDDSARCTVTVGQTSPPHDKEGEWDISLLVDGKPVFLLSFSVVPGWVAGSLAAEVALISRMQGVLGTYPEIKQARKALADVAPNALLLAALQGIAIALGIEELASVSALNQSVYREEIADRLRRAYDDFFADLGITRNDAGFLGSGIPISEKPMAFIKQGHKLRTKEKRALKRAIMLACLELFRAGRHWPSNLRDSRERRIRNFATEMPSGRHVVARSSS